MLDSINHWVDETLLERGKATYTSSPILARHVYTPLRRLWISFWVPDRVRGEVL